MPMVSSMNIKRRSATPRGHLSRRAGPRCASGFTLIELMIAVVIVAILAAIALPSYTQYIIRGKRAAAEAQMMDIANREQQYFLANRVYADTATLGCALPSDVSANYGCGIVVDNVGPPPTFAITLTPSGSQASDGWLSLDNNGTKGSQYSGKW